MSVFNLKSNVLLTLLGKSLILILNFAVTIFTARFWGAEGKGFIALFMANIGLATNVTNIFTASSVSYFLSRFGMSKLTLQAYVWVFIVSSFLGFFFHLADHSFPSLFFFIVATLLGLLNFHSSLFVGSQKIPFYNFIAILQPLLLIIFMLFFYAFVEPTYYAYFYGQICSFFVVFVVSRILTRKVLGKGSCQLDTTVVKQVFAYGWRVELSGFLQFLNYRLSLYFLVYYISEASAGVFSVGMSLAEAIWVVSRSISLVQYSNVLKQGNTRDSRKETTVLSWYSVWISAFCLLIACCLPDQVYSFVFGPEFTGIRKIILLLSPGVLAMALSNVYGNYFSAIGKTGVLILKSAVGVVVTVALSVILIPTLDITGACLVNSGSYLVSSVILVWVFYQGRNNPR